MLLSAVYFVVVALNAWFIWFLLFGSLRRVMHRLARGFRQVPLYFRCALTQSRERALRQRTLLLLRELGLAMFGFAAVLLLYLPSMLFAFYRSNLGDAFYSPEALGGMLTAAAAIGWRGRSA